jgi:hypothetical protein
MLAEEAKKRQATSTGGKTPQLRAKLPQADKGKATEHDAKLFHAAVGGARSTKRSTFSPYGKRSTTETLFFLDRLTQQMYASVMANHPTRIQNAVYCGRAYRLTFERANPPDPSKITVHTGSPVYEEEVRTVVAERFEDDNALNKRAHGEAEAHALAKRSTEGY